MWSGCYSETEEMGKTPPPPSPLLVLKGVAIAKEEYRDRRAV